MRTTIRLDDQVLREAKRIAAETGRTLAAVIDDLLREALDRTSLKDAVTEIATITGCPRREIYRRALTLTKDSSHG